MSRAIRRQQAAAPKETATPKTPRIGTGGPKPPTRGAAPPTRQKRRLGLAAPRWSEDIISELKKVTWPTRDETVYLTTVVIVVAVVIGTLLGSVDIFFNWLIDHLLLK